MKSFLRTPFVSALAGGLVVGLLGWAAIAAGWVEAEGGGRSRSVVTPATVPAGNPSSGDALSINAIYAQAAPGVAFISADVTSQAPSLNPFGSRRGSRGDHGSGAPAVILGFDPAGRDRGPAEQADDEATGQCRDKWCAQEALHAEQAARPRSSGANAQPKIA